MDMTPTDLILDGRRVSREEVQSVSPEDLEAMPRHLADLFAFLTEWHSPSDTVTVTTSGSTGKPKTMQAEKRRMIASAVRTCDFLGLKPGDKALLCMDLRYIGAKMMVVRSIVRGLDLVVVPPSGNPLRGVDADIDFAAFVPMQLYNMMQDGGQQAKLRRVRRIIIGGGAVSPALESRVDALDGEVYSTYGMTETLSHVAMRRLGALGDGRYHPLGGVSLTLSPDQTLVIDAPDVCGTRLVTNDLAEIAPDGSFVIIGRKDNVINSGGVKIIPEQVETALHKHLGCPLALTSVPDAKFGEAAVLLLAADGIDRIGLYEAMQALPPYHRPKHVVLVDSIPLTPNGKVARGECRRIAECRVRTS